MNTLKRIIITRGDEPEINVLYNDGLNDINVDLETISQKKTSALINICEGRLQKGEVLQGITCQVSPCQHLSTPRMRYTIVNDGYRFLPVDALIVATELKAYNEFIAAITAAIA